MPAQDPPPLVVVHVAGGVVQAVYAADPRTRVAVVDHDDLGDAPDPAAAATARLAGFEAATHPVA